MAFSLRFSAGRLASCALVAVGLLAFGADGAFAQGTYLKVDGINGESKEAQHKDWIDVQSFSIGVTQQGARAAGAGSAGAAGRASLSDLSVTKLVDASSPTLFVHACNGKHVKSVILEVTGSGGKGAPVYLRYTLTDVLVTGVQTSGAGAGADARPQEQVTFAYAKIQVEYIPGDPKGGAGKAIQGGWDVGTNKQASAPTEGLSAGEPSQAAASGEEAGGEQAAATPAPATARMPAERRAAERVRVRQP